MEESPAPSVVLNIAEVGFRISFLDNLPGGYEPCYLPFISPSEATHTSRSAIDISVHGEQAPPSDGVLVFESGGAWNMQMEPRGYRFNFHREGSNRYHTIACSDADTSTVRVYVHQDETESGLSPSSASWSPALSPVRYPLDQLLLMNHLSPLGGVIVHGAGVVIGETAMVFPGASGAGKSTLSQLFMGAGLGDSLLSDDRVILRCPLTEKHPGGAVQRQEALEERQVRAWGTPWPGDAGIARNASATLDALLFLVKADTNQLRPLSRQSAARRLMPVVTCPWYDAERLPGVLDTCSRIVDHTPCFELLFRPDAEVVEFLGGRPWLSEGGSS